MKANRFFSFCKGKWIPDNIDSKGFLKDRPKTGFWKEYIEWREHGHKKIQRKFDYITLGSFDTKNDKILCQHLKGKEKRWALVRNALKFAESFFFQELSKSSPGARCKNLPAWDLELHLNGGSFNLSETLNHFFRGGKIFHSWLLENNTKTRLQHIWCILKSSL